MPTHSFVRAAEIWVPGADGSTLVFGDGLYGALGAFGEHSRGVTFRHGEGLPGRAWAARHPVVMGSLKDPAFRRIEAAAEAGLSAGVAMPILAGDAIRAVVVLLCGDDADNVGALEVWMNDPEEDAQIGLHDGYYGAAELFEMTSRMKRFGRGFGLPGAVWAADMPVVIRDLYNSERFLRHEEARKVGLNLGLGLPFAHDPGRVWIMTVLSGLGTPIAGRFEIWVPEGGRLVYDTGLSEAAGEAVFGRPDTVGVGEGLLGRVLATGIPAATQDCAGDAPWLVGPDETARAHPAIAIPTLDPAGRLKAVTAWRF